MKLRIWGSRGSLPSSVTGDAIRKKIRIVLERAMEHGLPSAEDLDRFIKEKLPFSVSGSFGTNTSCVEIIGGSEKIVCDAGSGFRDLGNHYMKSGFHSESEKVFNLFISHLHWDHLQGFPFFTPIYIPGFTVRIFGGHEALEAAFRGQMQEPYFPVRFDELRSSFSFQRLRPGEEYEIAGMRVKAYKQNHPGDSYGYSFTDGKKKLVYSTDSEHQIDAEQPGYAFLEFIRDADVLIFDAQYNLMEAIDSKLNWGHSSNVVGVELAVQANIRTMILFHSDHLLNDFQIETFLDNTRKYHEIYDPESRMQIVAAYDGLEMEIE